MIQTCPTEDVLSAYNLGTLASEQADDLEGHLSECNRCREQFDALASGSDELIADLRHLAEAGALDPRSEDSAVDADRPAAERTTRLRGDRDTGNDRFVLGGRAGAGSAQTRRSLRTGTADRSRPIPVTADEIKRCLTEHRLIAATEVESAANATAFRAASGPGDEADKAIRFARHLVERGLLTCFQAAEICLGRAAGLRLDDYVIEDEIGRGGMGTVYRARHLAMQRTVALKVLSNRHFDEPETIERFRREALAIGRLNHANVVAAFDAGEDRGTPYLVFEYVNGVTLRGLVEANGPLPLEIAVDFVRQAATGLGAAHRQGVIHRDVKPSNLLVTRDGGVKVADLGLVRFLEETGGNGELTERGQVLGTLDYISPEQAFAGAPVGERSDIYSLGWTLYFLLTSKAAFPEQTQFSKLVAHRDAPIPSLQDSIPDGPASGRCPAFVDQLFRSMVAKKPADRPSSMAAVVEALSGIEPPTAGEIARLTIPTPPEPDLDRFFDDLREQTRGIREEQQRQRRQAERRRRSFRRAAIAALTGALLIVCGLAIYIQTSKGEVAVRFDGAADKSVEVRVYDGRKEVAVLNLNNDWTARLQKGDYTLAISSGGEKFRVESHTARVVPKKTTPIELKVVVKEPRRETTANPTPENGSAAPAANETIGEETAKLIGETGRVQICESIITLVLSPDRQTAYVGARDHCLYFVDLSTAKVLKRILAHRGAIGLLAVSRDGTRLASYGGDRVVRIWDAQTGKRLQQIFLPTYVRCLAFGPSRETVLAALDMKNLIVDRPPAAGGSGPWDHDVEYRSLMRLGTASGRAGETITNDETTNFTSLTCSQDGNTIIAGADDGTVHIFEREKAPAAGWSDRVRQFAGHRGPVHAVRLSEDGERLFSVGNANLLLCRRVADGRVEFGRRFRTGFTGIDVSGDESAFLVRGGFDVRFFDRNEEPARAVTYLRGHSTYIRGLYFLADETRAVSGGQDGTLRFWKLPNRRSSSL